MIKGKQLLGIGLGLCLAAGNVCAQQAPRQESPEVAAAEALALEEAARAEPEEGFGLPYGERLERQQEALEAAKKAEEAEAGNILAAVPQDSTIDYGSIADVMFSQGTASPNASAKLSEPAVQQSEDIIMTLTEPSSKANLGMGRTIDIKLRSASNLNWNFDKEYKSLEYLSSRDEDGFFHVVFKAKAPGKETVYFDCLDVADPMNVKVLETKMIVVKVGG